MNVLLLLRVLFGFVMAFSLTILPLPELFFCLRSPWVLLLIIYLQCFLPNYFSIALVLMVGILVDVLSYTIIGEHALALIIVTWLVSKKARRFKFFPLSQQLALVGFFCFIYQLVILLVESFLAYPFHLNHSLASILIAVLIWPSLKLLAEKILIIPQH